MGGSITVAMLGRVIQMSAVLACAGAACGGGQLGGDPPTGGLGGIMTSGGRCDRAGGRGRFRRSGRVGWRSTDLLGLHSNARSPVPFVDVFDPGPVAVACQDSARSAAVIRIGDQSGQGFDWRALTVPTPARSGHLGAGTACPGFTPQDVGVVVAFPDDCGGGQPRKRDPGD